MSESRRVQLADEMLRRFAASLRGAQLYAPSHPLVTHNIGALAETLALIHAYAPVVTIGLVGQELVVGDIPLPRTSAAMAQTLALLRDQGVERIAFDRGVTMDELIDTVRRLAAREPGAGGDPGAPDGTVAWFERHTDRVPHVHVGGLVVEKRLEMASADMAAVRQMYGHAVSRAEAIWRGVAAEGLADPHLATGLVSDLAQAVTHNRSALLALTALKTYDNYTFTHMVNVSILVMAQARSLGVDGPLLREFGLGGLLHDIGKVRTPLEILNKPEKLSDEEFAIMKRHPVDGAAILRRSTEIPPLAPLIAFEHHLRLDGRGYPAGPARDRLNLGTQLAVIADVYDAMRSKRQYQRAFPTDRILAVLQADDATRFDPHLVRRFVQVVGVYPVGNLVRLDTGDVAVVIQVHPSDPHRPQVRLLFAPDGSRYEIAPTVRLWQTQPKPGRPTAVVAPLDPAAFKIDPLDYV